MADIDALVEMFDDLIKGGLLSHHTLIEGGHTEVVTSMFLRPEPSATPPNPPRLCVKSFSRREEQDSGAISKWKRSKRGEDSDIDASVSIENEA